MRFRILRPPNTGIEIEQWEYANAVPEEFERSRTLFWSMEQSVADNEVLEYSNLNIPELLNKVYDDFQTSSRLLPNHPAFRGIAEKERLIYAKRLAVFLSRCCRHEAGKSTFRLPVNRFGWIPFSLLGEGYQVALQEQRHHWGAVALHHMAGCVRGRFTTDGCQATLRCSHRL